MSIALLTLKILSTEALLGNGVLCSIKTFLMLGVSFKTNSYPNLFLFKKLDTSFSMEMLEFEGILDQEKNEDVPSPCVLVFSIFSSSMLDNSIPSDLDFF